MAYSLSNTNNYRNQTTTFKIIVGGLYRFLRHSVDSFCLPYHLLPFSPAYIFLSYLLLFYLFLRE